MDCPSHQPPCSFDGGEPCRAFHALEVRLKLLESQSFVDPLTGALSREAIEEQGRNELSRMERYGHPCTLLLMDLDDLREVNARASRESGDLLLRRFCELALHVARRSDRIGRHGDDEFLMVLANTPLATGILMAERIRGALQYQPMTSDARLAASIAVVEARRHEDWVALLARARSALARAKVHKPNSVEAEENPEEVTAEVVAADFVKLNWRPVYECGDARIDEEHQRLFRGANDLLVAVANGAPRDELAPIASSLLAEVERHFEDEEEILRAAAWPGLEAHASIHAKLLARARELTREYLDGRGRPSELFEFLVFELVAAHLLREDRKYFAQVAPSTY